MCLTGVCVKDFFLLLLQEMINKLTQLLQNITKKSDWHDHFSHITSEARSATPSLCFGVMCETTEAE